MNDWADPFILEKMGERMDEGTQLAFLFCSLAFLVFMIIWNRKKN